MKYLDERIEITFTGNTVSSLAEGLYNWKLDECDIYGGSTTTIFVGNYYHVGGSTKDSFDITDIVRSRKTNIEVEKVETYSDAELLGHTYSVPSHTVMSYYLSVKNSSGSTLFGRWTTVEMVYRYPNVKRGITDGSNIFNLVDEIEIDDNPDYYQEVAVPLQGNKNSSSLLTNNGMYLIPHYPLKETDKYHIAQTVILGNEVTSLGVNFRQSRGLDDEFGIAIPQECYCLTFAVKPSEMFDWDYYQPDMTKDLSLYISYWKDVEDDDPIQYWKPIGIMDACPKRYYLMWEDRLGGFQSQAFNDSIQYSEDFQNTETINYKDERKKSFISLQPKWKLSSGWINENAYCIYESIFTSPTLRLYDSHEDVLYNVITSGNFVEKTYRNEKRLLNLTLDLEAISKQQIIY